MEHREPRIPASLTGGGSRERGTTVPLALCLVLLESLYAVPSHLLERLDTEPQTESRDKILLNKARIVPDASALRPVWPEQLEQGSQD